MIQTAGKLILSGTNTYRGGTFVEGGKLIVTNSEALLDGSNLTVGNPLAFTSIIAAGVASDGSSTSPVPEPGTLTLLAAGVLILPVIVRRRHRLRLAAIIAIALLPAGLAQADVFNMPNGQTSLQFVTVGDPGNVADTVVQQDRSSGYGSVPYIYQIGKYNVTLGQYVQFLNAVAKTDTYGCYSPLMAGYYGDFPFGISQIGSSGSYTYSVTGSNPQAANIPVYGVTWGDAVRFSNWLCNGQPTGGENLSTTESGAYYVNGATSRTALMAVASPAHSGSGAAKYFLPSENEWYKAAYYAGGGTNAGYWAYPRRAMPRRTTRWRWRYRSQMTQTTTSTAAPTRRTC